MLIPSPRSLIVMCALSAMTLSGLAESSTLRLWSTAHVSDSACLSHGGAYGPETHRKALQGFKYPYSRDSGIGFLDHTVRHINLAAIGRADDAKLRDRLLNAARGAAFSRLDFEGPGGSSPAFVSALIVRNVAYAVAYLRKRNALTSEQMKNIERWVRKLKRNSTARAGSLDHKAAIAASNLTWAAAIGDTGEFKKARTRLNRVLRKIKRKPYFVANLRNNNEVMHHVMIAAHVLRLNSIDVFNQRFGAHSLNDAVAHHAREVVRTGAAKLKTIGDPNDQARKILRAQGFGTHVAWVPIYLANVPSGGASRDVRALDAALRKFDRKPYWGMQIGIHSGCMFGR